MVIRNLDLEWPNYVIRPLEADSPLFVYTDATLSLATAPECLETITWQLHQVILIRSGLENVEPTLSLILERLEFAYTFA